MDLGLKGKVAIVTGGSAGIGRATVELLLQEGCRVAFCARGSDRVEQTLSELSDTYNNADILAQTASVLEADAMKQFAREVHEQFGACDLLVNNAGQGRVSTFADTSDQDWRDEHELKLFSQIYPIRAFRDQLDKSNSAAIVGVNSLLAYQPEGHMVCTAAARASVQNLLKSLSREFAPDIRVNSIALGIVESEQWNRRFEAREDRSVNKQQWLELLAEQKQIPTGRLGKPIEVANAIAFLGSPAAAYITGTCIEVSGGVSRFI